MVNTFSSLSSILCFSFPLCTRPFSAFSPLYLPLSLCRDEENGGRVIHTVPDLGDSLQVTLTEAACFSLPPVPLPQAPSRCICLIAPGLYGSQGTRAASLRHRDTSPHCYADYDVTFVGASMMRGPRWAPGTREPLLLSWSTRINMTHEEVMGKTATRAEKSQCCQTLPSPTSTISGRDMDGWGDLSTFVLLSSLAQSHDCRHCKKQTHLRINKQVDG